MAYYTIDGTMGIDFTATSTTKTWPLGTIVTAADASRGGGEFIYLQGVASTAVGSAVTYNADDFTTTLTVADAIGPVAIAMSANVANQYGWYQIDGKASVLTAAAVADDAPLYLTATAGKLDDAAVAGDYVHNAKSASAVGAAGTIDAEIHRPWCDNNEDDLDT